MVYSSTRTPALPEIQLVRTCAKMTLFPHTQVSRSWFTGHAPTPCANGLSALLSGCITAVIDAAGDIPAIHNTRAIMVQNDTHVFDLMQLSPVVGGWVLLGELERYVPVSADRFDSISASASGLQMSVSGSVGEEMEGTALQPAPRGDWIVRVQRVSFDHDKKTIIFKS